MAALSLVINTGCCGARAHEVRGSAGKASPHAWRYYALVNWILPRYRQWPVELIVVGEFEPGDGYTYVPCPARHFSCADALAQRQAGFEASTGNYVIFQHDDHVVDPLPVDVLEASGVAVLSPARWTRLRGRLEPLNSGMSEYILGHAAAYRRDVLIRCPWQAVPAVFTWDVAHTAQIREAGFRPAWTPDWRCYDVEMGAEPWR